MKLWGTNPEHGEHERAGGGEKTQDGNEMRKDDSTRGNERKRLKFKPS